MGWILPIIGLVIWLILAAINSEARAARRQPNREGPQVEGRTESQDARERWRAKDHKWLAERKAAAEERQRRHDEYSQRAEEQWKLQQTPEYKEKKRTLEEERLSHE